MKRTLNILMVTMAFAFVFWITNTLLWPFTGVRCTMNPEYINVMRITEESYGSWGFVYSDGHQYQENGTWKNLWHFPQWRHVAINFKEIK